MKNVLHMKSKKKAEINLYLFFLISQKPVTIDIFKNNTHLYPDKIIYLLDLFPLYDQNFLNGRTDQKD